MTAVLPTRERYCVGVLRPGPTFDAVCFHDHAPDQPHTDQTCKIRTYWTPETIDARWNHGTLLKTRQEFDQFLTTHHLPAEGLLVTLPTSVVEDVYGFSDARFAPPA